MSNASEPSSPSSAQPTARRDVRVVLVAVSLALLAVPFALTLLLVEDRWVPLLRADRGVRDGLHRYAVSHSGFVAVMQLISDSGSAVVWIVVLALVSGWLLWRRRPRHALFVVITAAGSSLLNEAVKTAVHRLRPVLTHPVAREQGLSFPSGHAQSATVGYAGSSARPPAHRVWSVAQKRRHVCRGHGAGDRFLPYRSWRPLRVRRRGRLCSWCGMGGCHDGCVQRVGR